MSAATLPAQPSPYAVLRNGRFVRLWSAQLVSTIGDALTSLAAGIIIFERTHSVLNVGLMLMATAVPTLVFGLVAGVVVDRVDRKKIMVASDLVRAGMVAAIPFLISVDIIWLYVIVMASASVTQFFAPASESVLPEIASEEELGAANAIMAIAQFGSTAIGFAAAGFLATTGSISLIFIVDAATFLFSATMISLVNVAPVQAAARTTIGALIKDIGSGARFIAATPILLSSNLVRVPVQLAFGMTNVLLLPFALGALNATEFEYGLQEGLTSVGFVIGSLYMARLSDRLREGQWLVISYIAWGALTLVYALQTSVWWAIFLISLAGAANAPSFVAGRLINQRNTPREMRGRVFSTTYVVRDVVYLVGMGMAGLADLFDVRIMFVLGGVAVVAAGFVAGFLPGLGQPAAEWRRAMSLLRGAASAPGMAAGRPVVVADLDLLGGYVPALLGLTAGDRESLVLKAQVHEAAAGSAITRAGDPGESAYFILAGRAVAGQTSGEGEYRALSSMGAGDFFGEIAALTGGVRSADVVAEEDTKLLEVPADTLRLLMAIPEFSHLVLGKMTERLARTTSINDLPRFGGIDYAALREARAESVKSPDEGSAAA